jgi:hypothetical protein
MSTSAHDHDLSPPAPAVDENLSRLEQLLLELEQQHGPSYSLMREHLGAARFYRIGAMPQEYEMNLKLATEVLPEIPDAGLRSRIGEFLRSQSPE